LPLVLPRLRLWLAHLNSAHDELGMQPLRPIFDAAEKSERRATLVATVQRAFALAKLTRQYIISYKNFAADRYAFWMRLAAARIERLLVGVHFTSPLCEKK